MTLAWSLAREGAPPGTLVLAREQRGGKGRGERRWFSPRDGGLWFSLVLRPPAPAAANLAALTLMGVLAALKSLPAAPAGAVPHGFHWPNDIIRGGRKLGGVLAQARWNAEIPEFIILGIGLNLGILRQDFPRELQDTATSLLLSDGQAPTPGEQLIQLAPRLQSCYEILLSHGSRPLISALEPHCLTLGKRVQVVPDPALSGATVEGIAQGLAPTGALVVEDGLGQRHEFWSANRVVVLE